MKKLLAGLLVLGTAVGPASLLSATPAAAATRCQGSTTSSRCITVSKVKKHLKVVESVPLENKSRKKATLHCSFTKTVSRTTTGSISLSMGIKAEVFKVVDLSTSIDLTNSISQSASQATSAGGSVHLKARESVMCQRTYGYVKANVKEVSTTSKKSTTRRYTVTVPVNMGVRIVDL